MPGGFMGDMPPQDKADLLNAQIAELTERKNNLQKEVDDYYREYKNNLNLDYNTKVGKIEKDRIVKEAELNKREDDIKKRESAITSAEISTKATSDSLISGLRGKEEALEKTKNSYQDLSIKLESDYQEKKQALIVSTNKLSEETERLRQKEQYLLNIQRVTADTESQVNARKAELETKSQDVESRIKFLEYLVQDVSAKEKLLKEREDKVSALETEIEGKITHINLLNKQAEEGLVKVNKSIADNNAKGIELDLAKEELKSRSKALDVFRNDLEETKLTLSERERLLTLRDRLISDKIKVLEQLRDADKK